MHCQVGRNRGILLQNWMFLCFILASATIPPFPPLNTSWHAVLLPLYSLESPQAITTGNMIEGLNALIQNAIHTGLILICLKAHISCWICSHKTDLHTQFNKTICYAFPSDFSNIASQQQQQQQLTNH